MAFSASGVLTAPYRPPIISIVVSRLETGAHRLDRPLARLGDAEPRYDTNLGTIHHAACAVEQAH